MSSSTIPTTRNEGAVIRRARSYVATMEAAVSGSHGHDATFKVAIALRHGFGLTMNEAWSLLVEYNARCVPPWSERELRHKLEQVEKAAHQKPRGHLLGEGIRHVGRTQENQSSPPISAGKRNWREFDHGALRGEQRQDINADAEWLWKRSPVDCRCMSAGHFLTYVCGAGDRILAFNDERSQGQYIFWNHPAAHRRGWYQLSEHRGETAKFVCGPEGTPADLRRAKLGVWWLCQPVTGEWKPNGDKWSRRSEGNVTQWRSMVVESDEEGIEAEWLNVLVQLPLRIVALYTSGGRSVHALVRVDVSSKAVWDQLRDYLKPVLTRLGADRGVFSAVRLTRLPGCQRQGRVGKDKRYQLYEEPKLQRLLFLNPDAEWRPIINLPVLRNGPMWEEAYA